MDQVKVAIAGGGGGAAGSSSSSGGAGPSSFSLPGPSRP